MLKPLDKSSLEEPYKYSSKWEETLDTAYAYWLNKSYCPECDTKRTKPCKCRLAKQPIKETL